MNHPDLFPETMPVVEVQSTGFTALLAERKALGQTPVAVTMLGVCRYRVTFSDFLEDCISRPKTLGPRSRVEFRCMEDFNSCYLCLAALGMSDFSKSPSTAKQLDATEPPMKPAQR